MYGYFIKKLISTYLFKNKKSNEHKKLIYKSQ